MTNNETPPAAGDEIVAAAVASPIRQAKRRTPARQVTAPEATSPADHVPAMLAATADGPAPVVEPVAAPLPLAATAPADAPALAPPAAAPAVHAIEDMTMDTIETTAGDTAAHGQAMFADLNTRAKDAMQKGSKMFEEMNAFGKGNIEAMVESSKIVAKGMESMGQASAELTRRSVEGATQAMKTLSQTRSPTEFFKLQSEYVRSMFDTMVAETSKSTEMMIKLANDVAQPISNRVAIAVEKVKLAA